MENPELATAKPESKAAMSALIEKEVKRKRAVEAAHFMAGARLAGWTGGAVVTRDDAALLAGHMAAVRSLPAPPPPPAAPARSLPPRDCGGESRADSLRHDHPPRVPARPCKR